MIQKKSLISFLLLLAAVCLSTTANAQIRISGRVTDSDGQPVIGLTVKVKGKAIGATTNPDGVYSITAEPDDVLVFSSLGYENVEQQVGDRTKIDVTMTESAQQLSAVEVVSLGYGTSLRRDLTGSVAKVNMDDLMKSNVTTFDQALTGRVPGVVVRTGDGELGQEARITIRGNNSISQSNSPLYVIDGVQTESSLGTLLNPNDIESIDVLKDASATAIYGARGANGVIVITTKSGKSGTPRVAFSSSFSVDKLANKMDLMDPYEFVKLQAELSPSDMALSYFSDGRDLEWYRDKKGYDWQDEVYRTAFTQNYNVSLMGGAPSDAKNKTLYNISFSALDQDGILLNSNFQRYQGRINFTQDIGPRVTFNLRTNYSRSVTSGVTPTTSNNYSSQSGWLIYSIWGYRPISSKIDSSDLINDPTDYDVANANDYRFNPVLSTQNEHRLTYVDLLQANSYLDFKLAEGLSFKTSGGYTLNKRRREVFNNSMTYTGYAGSPSSKGISGGIYWTDTETWITEATLNYDRKFGRNRIKLLGGGTLQGQKYTYDGIEATQLPNEGLSIQALYTGNLMPVKSVYQNWRQMSAFTRAEYNYNYKYYVNATFRADGSSRFPKDNQWGYFPSVGLSWNFGREDLLKNSPLFSDGKLRASWGMTGNNRTNTPYDFYAQMTTKPASTPNYDYVFDLTNVPGYFVSQMANEKLKWETTTQYNIGVDLGLLADRIRFTGDVYLKTTRDLLLSATMPASSGYTTAMINIGSIRNRGMEYSLETVNISNSEFQWKTSFNIAFNENKIISLVGDQGTLVSSISWEQVFNSDFPYISQVGMPAGMMFGLLYEGTYKYEDFNESGGVYTLKDGIPYHSSISKFAIQPGDPKYADMNDDGVVDDKDRTIIGRGQPIHTGGFGNTFTWRNFDLNVFMTWSYGNDILNANRLVFESGNRQNTNQLASYANRWTPENPNSDIPRAGANAMQYYSSRVVEDGSFLRLSNISLGYTLPQKAIQKMRLKSARVHVSLNNIYTITNYSGPDPEVSTRSSVLTPGFDWSAYPRTFGITAGLNLEF